MDNTPVGLKNIGNSKSHYKSFNFYFYNQSLTQLFVVYSLLLQFYHTVVFLCAKLRREDTEGVH